MGVPTGRRVHRGQWHSVLRVPPTWVCAQGGGHEGHRYLLPGFGGDPLGARSRGVRLDKVLRATRDAMALGISGLRGLHGTGHRWGVVHIFDEQTCRTLLMGTLGHIQRRTSCGWTGSLLPSTWISTCMCLSAQRAQTNGLSEAVVEGGRSTSPSRPTGCERTTLGTNSWESFLSSSSLMGPSKGRWRGLGAMAPCTRL